MCPAAGTALHTQRVAAPGGSSSKARCLRTFSWSRRAAGKAGGDAWAARGGPGVVAPAAAAAGGTGGTHSTFDSQSPFSQLAGLLAPAGAGGAASLPPSLPPAGLRVRPAKGPEGGESLQQVGASVSAPGTNVTSLARSRRTVFAGQGCQPDEQRVQRVGERGCSLSLASKPDGQDDLRGW